MAIKEPEHKDDIQIGSVDEITKAAPIVLTAEEFSNLYDSLAAPPPPLSPEVKRAIANYKRIKNLRIP